MHCQAAISVRPVASPLKKNYRYHQPYAQITPPGMDRAGTDYLDRATAVSSDRLIIAAHIRLSADENLASVRPTPHPYIQQEKHQPQRREVSP